MKILKYSINFASNCMLMLNAQRRAIIKSNRKRKLQLILVVARPDSIIIRCAVCIKECDLRFAYNVLVTSYIARVFIQRAVASVSW